MGRARSLAMWKEWRGTPQFLLLMRAFRSSFAGIYNVPTGSMKPTVVDGGRCICFIPRRDIAGRAFAVGYPLDPAHHYLPRLARPLQSLH